MYWIDRSDETGVSYIEQCYLDGTNRRILITSATGVVPLTITVDKATGYLYWADSDGTIERCDPNGNNRNVVYTSGSAPSVINGITIVEDDLYWVDKLSGVIWRANKFNGSGAVEILAGMKHIRGMSSADTLHTTGTSLMCWLLMTRCCMAYHIMNNYIEGILAAGGGRCQYNIECSHICLSNPDRRTCACPDGLTLDTNNHNCLSELC